MAEITTYSFTPATANLDAGYQAACLILATAGGKLEEDGSPESAQDQFGDAATMIIQAAIAQATALAQQAGIAAFATTPGGVTPAVIDAALGVASGTTAALMNANN